MKKFRTIAICLLALILAGISATAAAVQNPQTGSIGLETTISSEPPTRSASLSSPANGAVFTNIPITVSGICPGNVLVKVFSNNVFVGSVPCKNNAYSLQIDLFSGRNEIVSRVYDALDQAGPDSSVVVVTFDDAQFSAPGNEIHLTSNYALRGAAPNTELNWPITVTGGNSPYAISVDWGDGSASDLLSQPTAGGFSLSHTYKTAGLYKILVKASDKNDGKAFLQLTGQATGALQSTAAAKIPTQGNSGINAAWWAPIAMLPLIAAAFWAGKRHQTESMRRTVEKNKNV